MYFRKTSFSPSRAEQVAMAQGAAARGAAAQRLSAATCCGHALHSSAAHHSKPASEPYMRRERTF